MTEYKIIKFGHPDSLDIIYAQSCFSHVRTALMVLQDVYPNILAWFDGKVLPELLQADGCRQLFALLTPSRLDLAGFCILKRVHNERKICTLMVVPGYQGKGLGSRLFEIAFKALGTRQPSLTISSASISAFSPYIKKYEFQPQGTRSECYAKNVNEHIYN